MKNEKKNKNLPATATAMPSGMKKGGKVPEVKKDGKTPAGKAATPLAPTKRKGFMNSLFPGKDMGSGTRAKKGLEMGGSTMMEDNIYAPAEKYKKIETPDFKKFNKVKVMTGKELNNLKSYGPGFKKGKYEEGKRYLVETDPDSGEVVGVLDKKAGMQEGGAVMEPQAQAKAAMQQRRASADKAAQPANVPPVATAAPVPAGPKQATPIQPKPPVPAPAAPSPLPAPLKSQHQAGGKGLMGRLFPKRPKRGFEEGGVVDGGSPEDPTVAEPGEVMSTAPESSGEIIEGTEPVANAAAEAVPPVVEGELPAEVPGDGSDQVKTEGPFSEYLKEGVDPKLVERGNELTKRLGESAADDATMAQFMADLTDYIDELGSAVKTVQSQGGGEMLRGLKGMLKDAQDLMAAHENVMAETGSADQAIQNAPDIVLQASRKNEAA